MYSTIFSKCCEAVSVATSRYYDPHLAFKVCLSLTNSDWQEGRTRFMYFPGVVLSNLRTSVSRYIMVASLYTESHMLEVKGRPYCNWYCFTKLELPPQ